MSICFNPKCGHQNPIHLQFCERCKKPLLLNNRYRGLRKIGQGGFSKTYLAIDEIATNHSQCVVKQFFPSISNSQKKSAKMFRDEAKRLQLIDNPSIPKLLDYLEIDQEQYIIQEFIFGNNLEEILQKDGFFSEEKITNILEQILPILKYLHDRNLIHRDIKPANIIRRYGDHRLFLVDFGTTKLATGTALAKTGTSIGTAEFVAPEQLRGKAIFASDLYSLGVTCLNLLTNTSPFNLLDGDGDWVWQDWLGKNKVSAHLVQILNRLISPRLSVRYSCAKDVLFDLQHPRIKPRFLYFRYGGGGVIAFIMALFSLTKIFEKQPFYQETLLPIEPIIRETNLEVIKLLSSYAHIQNENFLDTGKFLSKMSQTIALPSHYFDVQIINNGVQIAAIPRQKNSYGYVAILWGGKISNQDQQRQQNWQPQDPTDIGTFTLPNFRKTPSIYTTRVMYCESRQSTLEPPKLSSLGKLEPLSSYDLPCPEGYSLSLGVIDAIAKLAATIPEN